MCLTLYLGTHADQPDLKSSPLTVERVAPEAEHVRRWFSLPHVCFVGAHTGCSCGLPYVVAEEPFDYWEGMFDESEERQNDRRSLQALLDLVCSHVLESSFVELYPVWNGEETLPPKGRIRRNLASLTPETFFFIERFVYELTSD
jgi:hypothetical protein